MRAWRVIQGGIWSGGCNPLPLPKGWLSYLPPPIVVYYFYISVSTSITLDAR